MKYVRGMSLPMEQWIMAAKEELYAKVTPRRQRQTRAGTVKHGSTLDVLLSMGFPKTRAWVHSPTAHTHTTVLPLFMWCLDFGFTPAERCCVVWPRCYTCQPLPRIQWILLKYSPPPPPHSSLRWMRCQETSPVWMKYGDYIMMLKSPIND